MAVAEQQASPGIGPDPAPDSGSGPAAETTKAGPRRLALPVRVAHHTLRHTLRLAAIWLIAGTAFAVAFVMLVALTLRDGPLVMPGWVTHRIEAQMNRDLTVGRVSLGRVEVQMDTGRRPQVRLMNVGLFDSRGAEVARLNEVGAGFEMSSLVRGYLLPRRLRLSGAQITVRRRSDGSLDLSFGQAGGGASGSLAGVLDTIDRLFSDGPLTRIERIDASELTITLEDARTDRLWQVTDGRLAFRQTARDIEISVGFDVFNGTEDMAATTMTFRSDKGSPAAEIGVTFANAASGDIALQSPVLAFLGVLDAPISGALRLAIGADARLTDFAGSLEIGSGTLTPQTGQSPIRIDRGKAYFTYDADRQRIDFSDLDIESDALAVRLSGQTFLRDPRADGWPGSFVGQFRLVDLRATDADLLAAPMAFHDGEAELKLQLDPFALTVGKLRLKDGDSTIALSGRIAATPEGPEFALDAAVDRIDSARLLALWPPAVIPKTREWLAENLLAGEFSNARAALRKAPDAPPRYLVGADFSAATVRYARTLPPVQGGRGYLAIAGNRLTVRADAGRVVAPEGGTVDVAGTVFTVPDVDIRFAPAEVHLFAKGTITATLSLLDQEPLRVMQKAGRPVDLAEGTADLTAELHLALKPHLQADEVRYSASGTLRDVVSDRLVPGRRISAGRLRVATDGEMLRIDGKARLGQLPVVVAWSQPTGPGATADGKVMAEVELGPAFLREFNIGLPDDAVKGAARARVEISLPKGAVPKFSLASDLQGVALRLDSIAWSKPAAEKGLLELSGSLGAPPAIDRIAVQGGGLNATGAISLNAAGQLAEAKFDRVRLGGWLDAPVTLFGRGAGVQPGVVVRGGTLDFRRAAFGSGAGGKGGGGPVTVRLDRVSVADGIDLTGFQGDFSTLGGFSGRFAARLNGGGRIVGTVAPQNGGTALKVESENAGEVLRDAKVAQRVRGGAMELILLPTGRRGTYDGWLKASTVRVRGTPALAELLNAVSIVGLLQQLNGDGLVFDEVEARFILTPNAINFTRASGIGASLGISAEGSYTLATVALDISGVFSPIYLLNGIGQIFTRKGEGLFGVTYHVTGTSEAPKVSVNPLSLLTPGMFRELFRRAPPKVK